MITVWGQLTLAFYIVSLILYGWFLYANRRIVGQAATACLAVGLATHFYSLLERARALDTVPYQDLYGSMSLFAWLVALIYLGLEAYHRQRSVGPFVLPFVLILMLVAAAVMPEHPPAAPAATLHDPLFPLHVTANILAYSAFAISFVLSLIYLIQNRVLRDRHPGTVFWRFPALEVLDRMSRSGVFVGVVALSLGIVLGLIWAHRIRGHFWSADAKEIASFVILACYGGYLWLSRTTRWRGARAAMLCIFNFLLVLFSYTLVNLYLSRYHRYF